VGIAIPRPQRSAETTEACPRNAAFRQHWFAIYGRILLPSTVDVAKRLTTNHNMKLFLTRLAAEIATLLQAVSLDLPSLTHVDIVRS
jgi:hypothetical protein